MKKLSLFPLVVLLCSVPSAAVAQTEDFCDSCRDSWCPSNYIWIDPIPGNGTRDILTIGGLPWAQCVSCGGSCECSTPLGCMFGSAPIEEAEGLAEGNVVAEISAAVRGSGGTIEFVPSRSALAVYGVDCDGARGLAALIPLRSRTTEMLANLLVDPLDAATNRAARSQ